MKGISIVIPTYNRRNQLSSVLDHILNSDATEFDQIEIFVVDDGSTDSPRSLIETIAVDAPFILNYVRQENLGPAAARNNGFARASHEIVLFIDDDILVTPELIRQHYQAHIDKPSSVIYGRSPYLIPDKESAQYQYLRALADEYKMNLEEGSKYEKVDVVASGNISMEKRLFPEGKVYSSGLTIPASEEFALALSLLKKNVQVFFAKDIFGWHLQPATIEDSCKQNHKYGLGIAEVIGKIPEVLELGNVKNLYTYNRKIQKEERLGLKLKKSLRATLATKPLRLTLLRLSLFAEKVSVPRVILFRLFRLVIGAHFTAGIQEGERRFGPI